MAKNLYIAATEADSGKSLIVLGLMNILTRHVKKVGFFRPVVRSGETHKDKDIELVTRKFNLSFPYESMYGIKGDEAFDLIQDDKMDEVFSIILNKYKKLESKCDFILCEGTDYRGALKPFEFDFNAQMANNLGAPVIAVINGFRKSVVDVADTVQLIKGVLSKEKCQYIGMFVNRVKNEDQQAIINYLSKIETRGKFDFVIPEISLLQKLTIRQISNALKAKLIYGDQEVLDYDVMDYKIGAMGIDNILKYTTDGTVVVTPGDRTDVLVTLFMTLLSDTYPKIAGIILTGGISPNNEFLKLINGIRKLPLAICRVDDDTYNTVLKIQNIKPQLSPDNERRMAVALGHFEKHVDELRIRDQIEITSSGVITPLMFEYELFERARANKKHIVLPEGLDERILRAAEILLSRNVVDITLLGNEEEILSKAASLHLKIGGANIIDPNDNDLINDYAATYYRLRKEKGVTKESARDTMHDPSYLGTMMVYKGHADGMVSGAANTTQHTIRPAFEFIKTKPGFSIVSSSFLMCFEDRVLVYGDCAVNPNPNSEQLADIAISSSNTAKMFGIEPRIAMLSYSTGQSGKGADVEKVREATRIVRERHPELKVEGPIQYDAAIDATVAKQKMPGSEVAGKATVYIFPDLNTGNNTYKAVQRASGAVAVGPVLQGLNKPVNDLSRGCLVKDIVNTVMITAIQAQENEA
ncbi:MAG: phosphate acetyltransferase [Bacteroidales bacterium]|nr:phosphate acetyltransferase [Bacteroidales bacterium]MCF8404774.1 phosphate acetyltransferase [Bacteroidales bacterium]